MPMFRNQGVVTEVHINPVRCADGTVKRANGGSEASGVGVVGFVWGWQ
jgi:hypothetical protein